MKIGINTRLIVNKGMTGIGVYTLEVASRLAKLYTNITWVWYFDRKPPPHISKPENVIFKILPPPTRHYKLVEWWFDYILPFAIKRDKIDLFFGPETYLPKQSNIPMVNVLHDLNFLHSAKYLPNGLTKHYSKRFAQGLKSASSTICISEFTKQDALRHYSIKAKKLFTIYNGFGQHFSPISIQKKTAIQKQYSNGNPYIIFTGILVERKNVAGMIKAFLKYKEKHQDNVKFLIIGHDGGAKTSIAKVMQNSPFSKDVIFTGYIGANKSVQSLVAGAEAMLYVSHFEGFGLPALEAMQAQVPVITSNTSAIPEIVGDAALLCNPNDINKISDAINEVMHNSNLRKTLIQKGLQRIRKFDWDITSKKIGELLIDNAKKTR